MESMEGMEGLAFPEISVNVGALWRRLHERRRLKMIMNEPENSQPSRHPPSSVPTGARGPAVPPLPFAPLLLGCSKSPPRPSAFSLHP